MTDDEFEAFVASAFDELTHCQERLEAEFGLGSHDRWAYDQTSGRLDFFDADGAKVLEASTVLAGSHHAGSRSWQWGWANASLAPAQRDRAKPLEALASRTGYDLFANASPFNLHEEGMAWELAAMSMQHLGGIGVYRAPSSGGELFSFLVILSVDRMAR